MRLAKGQGSEKGPACWMSALHFYTRKDATWTDQAPWACVCPVIRALCIGLNDLLDDGEREAVIGPHLFTPVGTADDALLAPRAAKAVEFAQRCAGLAQEAAKLAAAGVPPSGRAHIRKAVVDAQLALILELCAMSADKACVAPVKTKAEVLARVEATEAECSKILVAVK